MVNQQHQNTAKTTSHKVWNIPADLYKETGGKGINVESHSAGFTKPDIILHVIPSSPGDLCVLSHLVWGPHTGMIQLLSPVLIGRNSLTTLKLSLKSWCTSICFNFRINCEENFNSVKQSLSNAQCIQHKELYTSTVCCIWYTVFWFAFICCSYHHQILMDACD